MTLSAWLDARDGEAVARAWRGLTARRVEVGGPRWTNTAAGTARFAAAFLGWPLERFAWFTAPDDALPPPTFDSHRVVTRSFVEHAVDCSQECYEDWQIREVVDGVRGFQHIKIGFAVQGEGRDGDWGGSGTIVRVFDRSTSTAASINLHANTVWTIGRVDLTALDVFSYYTTFTLPWPRFTLDAVRGLIAQLATEVDAHFDVSATWPGALTETRTAEDVVIRTWRYESGPYALEIIDYGTWLWVTVHGLPWGFVMKSRIDNADTGVEGNLQLALPLEVGETVVARLALIPGITGMW
ncbi:MAG TPA: hypothetical protein VFQ53_31370 [Kofleriaceae bacterium]|nr:hypothetical protein [Kofleriaceae bacterium]